MTTKRKPETPSSPRKRGKMPPFKLTPGEQRLKAFLLDVAASIDASLTHAVGFEPITLRWAGGWVRDKLLGIPSEDIDTAINIMTGWQFATEMKKFCETKENLKKHGLDSKDVGYLHKIAQNPDKSKHLETVVAKVMGYDIDFVNLRKEEYTTTSRNPIVAFGTPLEDATRRDATINALFYNLNTDAVEDFVEGVPDLQAKLIRTPMPPHQTFTDDPLRILRLVRFTSRLNFTIDPDTKRAMGEADVLETLRLKITRERVGIELEKMMKGRNPRASLDLINEIGLYNTIFTDPVDLDFPKASTENWDLAYDCLHGLVDGREGWTTIADFILGKSRDDTVLAWYLVAALPHFSLEPAEKTGANGKAIAPFATVAVREGFKATNKIQTLVTAACAHLVSVQDTEIAFEKNEEWTSKRDELGMKIRRWNAEGGHWRLQVLAAMLFEVLHGVAGHPPRNQARKHTHQVVIRWQQFVEHIQDLDLGDCPTIKPLVDGRQLQQALGVKIGPWMKPALDQCIAWQLRNPTATNPDDAVEFIKGRRKELGIPDSPP